MQTSSLVLKDSLCVGQYISLNLSLSLSLGLASNLNVNNHDIGSVGFKEPQSRLKKWTAMDVSLNSPLDQNPSKPGESKKKNPLSFGVYQSLNR